MSGRGGGREEGREGRREGRVEGRKGREGWEGKEGRRVGREGRREGCTYVQYVCIHSCGEDEYTHTHRDVVMYSHVQMCALHNKPYTNVQPLYTNLPQTHMYLHQPPTATNTCTLEPCPTAAWTHILPTHKHMKHGM